MGAIKLRSLEFFEAPFRKLGEIKIDFSDRITLIAGHNGIGKSTILGLVANTFGLTDKGAPKSYFGEAFSANIERIVYLSLEEVAKSQENNSSSAPVVTADVAGIPVRKRCAMTRRDIYKRARVVPRTLDKAEGDPVKQDGKVPLATIYLGIRRLASVGEADERDVTSSRADMDRSDRQLMMAFVNEVIVGATLTDAVTQQSIKGSGKKTAQPGYELHDAHAISLGQDSLGSIATALASFQRLKRLQGDDYPGGLLVIDELDAGLHPHAIDRLVKALRKYSKQLKLQVVATTHSPRLIENVHPEASDNRQTQDSVIYLHDTRNPRLAPDQSVAAILDDMALRVVEIAPRRWSPALGVYFEDEEAKQFFETILPVAKRKALGKKYGVRIKPIGLGVGGSNLVKLPKQDPIFGNRVLVVDADTTVPQTARAHGNIVKLPVSTGAIGTARSPENMIKAFLRETARAKQGPFYEAMRAFSVTNSSTDKVEANFFQDGFGSNDRVSSKNWWKAHWRKLNQWKVIEGWATVYGEEVAEFVAGFEAALKIVAERTLKN